MAIVDRLSPPNDVLYQTGTICEIRVSIARVEIPHSGGCGGCAGARGCGLGPILSMFKRARRHTIDIDLANVSPDIRVGDPVRIAISGRQLLKAVIMAYVVPMSGLLVGALLASKLFPQAGDFSALVGAGVGMLCVSQLLVRQEAARSARYLRSARVETSHSVESSAR